LRTSLQDTIQPCSEVYPIRGINFSRGGSRISSEMSQSQKSLALSHGWVIFLRRLAVSSTTEFIFAIRIRLNRDGPGAMANARHPGPSGPCVVTDRFGQLTGEGWRFLLPSSRRNAWELTCDHARAAICQCRRTHSCKGVAEWFHTKGIANWAERTAVPARELAFGAENCLLRAKRRFTNNYADDRSVSSK
jgi:hypothetical protein